MSLNRAKLEQEEPIVEIEESQTTDVKSLGRNQPILNIEDMTKSLLSKEMQGCSTNIRRLHGIAATHFDSWRIAAGSMAALGLDDHAISAFLRNDPRPTDAKCHLI